MSAAAEEGALTGPADQQQDQAAPPPAPPDPHAAEERRQAALRRAYGGREPVRAGDVAGQLTHLPARVRQAHEAAGRPVERYYPTPEEGREYARALQRELMVARFRRALMADYSDFADATLDGLEPPEDPGGKVTRWVAGQPRTLLLAGEKGVGKTHVAIAVGRAAAHGDLLWPLHTDVEPGEETWVRRPASVALWSEPDLIEATMPKQPGRDAVLAEVVGCDLLILDELGASRRTEWTLERIGAVASARTRQAGRRTVYTTNLPYDSRGWADTPLEHQPVEPNLTSKYDDRIADRLIQDAVLVRITGRSRRRPAPY